MLWTAEMIMEKWSTWTVEIELFLGSHQGVLERLPASPGVEWLLQCYPIRCTVSILHILLARTIVNIFGSAIYCQNQHHCNKIKV